MILLLTIGSKYGVLSLSALFHSPHRYLNTGPPLDSSVRDNVRTHVLADVLMDVHEYVSRDVLESPVGYVILYWYLNNAYS